MPHHTTQTMDIDHDIAIETLEIETLNKEVKLLRARLARREKQVETLLFDNEHFKKEVATLNRTIAILNLKIESLDDELELQASQHKLDLLENQ